MLQIALRELCYVTDCLTGTVMLQIALQAIRPRIACSILLIISLIYLKNVLSHRHSHVIVLQVLHYVTVSLTGTVLC